MTPKAYRSPTSHAKSLCIQIQDVVGAIFRQQRFVFEPNGSEASLKLPGNGSRQMLDLMGVQTRPR